MPEVTLGPWVKGLVNTILPEGLGQDALLRAENVDVDLLGFVKTRTQIEVLGEVALTDPARVFVTIGGTPVDTGSGAIVVGKRYTSLNGQLVGINASGLYNAPGAVLSLQPGDDRYLSDLPGGQYVEAWNGRLVVARGTSLLYSEPLNYGAYDPMRNFVMFPQQITWLAPLSGGIFVGTQSYVYFLAGPDPEKWLLKTVDGPSWAGAGGSVNTMHMKNLSEKEGRGQVACWFTARGFVFGYEDGAVVAPQEDKLTRLPIESGRLVQFNDRLWVLPL